MIRKDVIIAVLATFCLTSSLFMITTSQSQVGEYNPWADYNEDGVIDIFDIVPGAVSFGAEGDPTKNVNVVNWPDWMYSAKNGINQSLALDLVVPSMSVWRSSNVMVDGYSKFYYFINVSTPTTATYYLETYFRAGGIEELDYNGNIGPWPTTYVDILGPLDIEGPEIFAVIRNEDPASGDIHLSLALYAPP